MFEIKEYYAMDKNQNLIKIGPVYISPLEILYVEKAFGPDKNSKIPANLSRLYTLYEESNVWFIHTSQFSFAVDEKIAKDLLFYLSGTVDKTMYG